MRVGKKAESIVALRLVCNQRTMLILEPAGQTYDVAPEQEVELRTIPPQAAPLLQANEDGSITLWCEGFASIFIDGVEVHEYLPTEEELARLHSPESARRIEVLNQRRADAIEVIERFKRERPEEFQRTFARLLQLVQDGVPTEQIHHVAAELDPAIVRALMESGTLPLLSDGG